MRFSRSESAQFKLRRKHKRPITASPLFVPVLALWGAALAGLAVFVLPASIIDQISQASALTVLGGLARFVFAGIAALIGAACLYLIANALRGSKSSSSAEAVGRGTRRVKPIDPAELGSDSLDAPIDDSEYLEEDLELDDEYTDEGEFVEEFDEVEPDAFDEFDDFDPGDAEEAFEEPEPESKANRFLSRNKRQTGRKVELVQALNAHLARKAEESNSLARQKATHAASNAGPASSNLADELDLGAFAEGPFEPVAEVKPAPSIHQPPATAAEKLRAVPPHELNLVHMVERFALALHEHQQATHAQRQANAKPERDAALAEALKTLAKFTQSGFDASANNAPDGAHAADSDATQDEMRDALARLQNLRGAA